MVTAENVQYFMDNDILKLKQDKGEQFYEANDSQRKL